jgi:hypothetical protein
VKNRIEDLRNHLFATLEDLRDKDHPMDINRAKAIANVAAQIVNSAKVENDYARLTGGKGTGFIPDGQPALPVGAGKEKVTVHRLGR